MVTVVMVTGKRVGGLSYALQSSEWLEFNMETSSCVLTGNNVPPLLLFLHLSHSYSFSFGLELSPLCKYCFHVHCVNSFMVLQIIQSNCLKN